MPNIAPIKYKLALIILLTAINSYGFASRQSISDPNKPAVTNPSEATTKTPAPPQTNIHFCPQISELSKDNLLWSARGGLWKSFSQSFATAIDHFIGAQWIGVNVGKIICLYQGQGTFDFPIALEPVKTILILEPRGGIWKSDNHEGYKFCRSDNVNDCPFYTKIEETDVNIYERIKYQGEPGKISDSY